MSWKVHPKVKLSSSLINCKTPRATPQSMINVQAHDSTIRCKKKYIFFWNVLPGRKALLCKKDKKTTKKTHKQTWQLSLGLQSFFWISYKSCVRCPSDKSGQSKIFGHKLKQREWQQLNTYQTVHLIHLSGMVRAGWQLCFIFQP